MLRRCLLMITLSTLTVSGCRSANKTDDTGVTQGNLETDDDGDGFLSDEDCDDGNADVNPDQTEICDGLDNDCDDEIDEGVTTTYYEDDDGDGFGDAADPIDACAQPSGYVDNQTDCDDRDAEVSPDATELCNGIDDDCDGDRRLDPGVRSPVHNPRRRPRLGRHSPPPPVPSRAIPGPPPGRGSRSRVSGSRVPRSPTPRFLHRRTH